MGNFDHLPYRDCVGIMLINHDNKVWVGQRIPKDYDKNSELLWQMPQGGIDEGETPVEAALRELKEETGVFTADVIGETKDWLFYDLPEHLLGVGLKGRYKGQRQKWFAMRFFGDESEIDIDPQHGHEAEFSQWRWVNMDELADLVVPFKRDVYLQVVSEFQSIK